MIITAMHSFRGGSGKTFVALNLATTSARQGKKVVIMDTDFASPSFQSNLETRQRHSNQTYGNDVLLGQCDVTEVITPTNIPNLDVIYANPQPTLGKGLLDPSEQVHWVALQHLSELREKLQNLGYDYLYLDTTPNLSYSGVSALTIADSIVIVHRPVIHTIDLTVYILKTIYNALKKSLKPRKFYVIYNQVPNNESSKVESLLSTLTTEFKRHLEVEILGSIPLYPSMNFWDSLLIDKNSSKLEQFHTFFKHLT